MVSTPSYLKELYLSPHQICKVVTILSGHESAGVAEASDVLDVRLQPWRVCFQHNVDESGKEIVGRCSLFLADFDGIENVFTATCDARQLVLRYTFRIHFDDIWNKEQN